MVVIVVFVVVVILVVLITILILLLFGVSILTSVILTVTAKRLPISFTTCVVTVVSVGPIPDSLRSHVIAIIPSVEPTKSLTPVLFENRHIQLNSPVRVEDPLWDMGVNPLNDEVVGVCHNFFAIYVENPLCQC